MELWIRSQEGTLGKVLFIRPAGFALDVHFVGNYVTSEHFTTEERALEVLDEIQNILNLKDMYKYDRELLLKSWDNVDAEQVKIVREQMSVYEMPEE